MAASSQPQGGKAAPSEVLAVPVTATGAVAGWFVPSSCSSPCGAQRSPNEHGAEIRHSSGGEMIASTTGAPPATARQKQTKSGFPHLGQKSLSTKNPLSENDQRRLKSTKATRRATGVSGRCKNQEFCDGAGAAEMVGLFVAQDKGKLIR